MAQARVRIGGRELTLKNLDKVLYPAVGFTKGQVIDYYVRAAPVLLPHLKGRPLTLKRYPDGVDGGFFYEKRCPKPRPEWIHTEPVWSEGNQEDIHYCVINEVAALVWLANLANLELHTFLSPAGAIELPTAAVFDLDPGPPADIVDCCKVAMLLRELLERLGLVGFPKTSGSKGLQVYLPLNTPHTYERTKEFARAVAELLDRRHPERVVSRMARALRVGKVFIDWSQNDEHKTTVCVYSLRAKERPMVSTPVTWTEVAVTARERSPLAFDHQQALARVERHGDLFAQVLTLKQRLPAIVGEAPARPPYPAAR